MDRGAPLEQSVEVEESPEDKARGRASVRLHSTTSTHGRRSVRIHRQGFPIRGDFSESLGTELGFILAGPVLAVGWLVWKLWLRGAYNVAVVEDAAGRERLVWRERASNRADAERLADEIRQAIDTGSSQPSVRVDSRHNG